MKRRKMSDKVSLVYVICAFVAFALTLVCIFTAVLREQKEDTRYIKSYYTKKEDYLSKQLIKQDEVDKSIMDASESGSYTVEHPLVLRNPYGTNPLSAIIVFDTEEDTSIGVQINDVFMSTFERSKKHIIPVYGLLSNTMNTIKFTTDDGTSFVFTLETETVNNNLKDFQVSSMIGNYQHFYIVGDTSSNNSILRGFDYYNNCIFYLDMSYVNGLSIHDDSIYVGYSLVKTKDTNLKDIRLELDFLGRIKSISTNTSDLIVNSNINLEGSYYGVSYNTFKDYQTNYVISDVYDNNPYDAYKIIGIDTLKEELDHANVYTNPYNIAVMGDYITYDIGDTKEATILLIDDKNKVYMFDTNSSNMFKTDITGKFAVYMTVDNAYYNLMTTIIKGGE